ncbi:hypothetical protein ACIA8I_13660 [Streptomyces rishiriensis]|uniref:hypothetical protein n=1 Tax=Streptomyces rishiriensis TaxID=68264 RepID=UPI00378864BE
MNETAGRSARPAASRSAKAAADREPDARFRPLLHRLGLRERRFAPVPLPPGPRRPIDPVPPETAR